MQEAAFQAYMRNRELADRTRAQRLYALKRIEKFHAVDLDAEFDRDDMRDLLDRFSYSAADERAGRPNPSKLDIDQDKLLTHLRWYRSHLTDYRRFRGGGEVEASDAPVDGVLLSENVLEEAVGKTFGLERDLQSALRANIDQLEEGLTVADGGSETKVEAGFIDILARDRHGVLTAIELKAETSRPDAIAQILSYMGCLAEREPQIRGILVAGDHHPRVVQAARAIPNLSLKKYRYRFEFE